MFNSYIIETWPLVPLPKHLDRLTCSSYRKPLVYFRFVDDVWGLWTHGQDASLDFHTKGNQIIINPRIKLELRFSTEQLEFLDTVMSLRGASLHTDLYTKPTDKHLYLHMESSHPEATKKALPYGLGVRVKRICLEEGNYRKHR